MLYRGFVVDADGDEVQVWFRTQLAARGWELGITRQLTPEESISNASDAFYARGSEHLTVRVLGRNFDGSPTHWLPPLKGEKGLFYDIMLSDESESADGGGQ